MDDPLRLESQCVNGDVVSDMHTRQELRCLQCHADLTEQRCSHHPTAPVCEECGENIRANGHEGTCLRSVMRGGPQDFAVAQGDIPAGAHMEIDTRTGLARVDRRQGRVALPVLGRVRSRTLWQRIARRQ